MSVLTWTPSFPSLSGDSFAIPSLEELPARIAEALTNRYVQLALVVGMIAVSCLLFPVATTAIATIALWPLRQINSLLLAGMNFLPAFSPFVQITVSIAALALGCFASSSFFKGYSSYMDCSLLSILSMVLYILALPFQETHLPDSMLPKGLKNALFFATIIAPLTEEIFFRVLVPLVVRSGLYAISFLAYHITGTDYTPQIARIRSAIENIFSSGLFGMMHFNNRHSLRLYQALYTGGLACLNLFPTYQADGLPAAISAHATNNIWSVTMSHILDYLHRLLP